MPSAHPADRPAALPLAPVACAVAAGTACGYSSQGAVILGFAAPFVIALAAFAARLRPALLGLLLGLVLGRLATPELTRPPSLRAAGLPAVHAVEGEIVQVDPTAERTQRLVVRIDALGAPPRRLLRPQDVDVRLYLRGIAPWSDASLLPGARVRALVRVALRRGRLVGRISDRRALEITNPASSLAGTIARLRRAASWTISRAFDRRDDGLARALLLGDRGRLDARDRTLFRRTGQAHLLAVSGLHVGLLLGGILLLLRVLGASPRLVWSAGLVLVAVYVPFTGTQPSAVRAGLGAAAWFLARLFGRRPWGAAILTLVGLCVVTARPAAVGQVSFQMSFAAVTAIFLLGPRLRARFVPDRPVLAGLLPPRRAPLRSALAISVAAWLGTAPFVATHIGRLCPAGPFVSIVALPLTAVLLASGFVLLIAAPVPGITAAAGALFQLAAGLMRRAFALARAVHLDAYDVARPSPLWWLLYAGAFVLAARARGRWARAGWILLPLLLALLFAPAGVPLLSAPHGPWNQVPDEYDATVPSAFTPPNVVLPGTLPLLLVAAGLFGFALVSVLLKWLGPRAAGAAWGLGVLAFMVFRASGVAALFAPFLGATLLGRLPGSERAGARNLRQVLCNGVPAFLGCLLAISGRPDLGGPFFLGALACLGGDSCATEVGVRYGGRPFRLAGRGPIRKGESGGVTGAGLVATVLGAALAPAGFLLLSDVPARALGLVCAAGVTGSVLDSVLGGGLQFRGRVPGTDDLTEAPWLDGAPTERLSGWRWLDNDAVNLVSGMAAGVLGIAFASLG